MTPFLAAVGALCVALPLLVLALWRVTDRVVAVVVRIAEPLSTLTSRVDPAAVEERVESFVLMCDRVGRSRGELLRVTGLSYVGWMLFAAPLWFAAKALGVHLDPLLVAFVVPASTFASIVPTPGGVGGVEAAIVILLTGLAGVTAATVGAIALLYRLCGYWFLLTLGGAATLRVSTR